MVRKLGLKRAEPRGLVLGDMGLCLTAAVEGAGVAIGRSLLVADAISDGRLVPALATAPDVLSTKVHIARWSPDLIGDRNTQVLVSWLRAGRPRKQAVVCRTAHPRDPAANETVPRADGPAALSMSGIAAKIGKGRACARPFRMPTDSLVALESSERYASEFLMLRSRNMRAALCKAKSPVVVSDRRASIAAAVVHA